MKDVKRLYGKTAIDNSDSDELKENYKIELEYYQIKNSSSSRPYGIEVVKRIIEDSQMNIENKIINNICYEKQTANELLDILISNKVTPISVEDVINDLKKIRTI